MYDMKVDYTTAQDTERIKSDYDTMCCEKRRERDRQHDIKLSVIEQLFCLVLSSCSCRFQMKVFAIIVRVVAYRRESHQRNTILFLRLCLIQLVPSPPPTAPPTPPPPPPPPATATR
jgi:hypothetical protein